jgi:hypothetical protein
MKIENCKIKNDGVNDRRIVRSPRLQISVFSLPIAVLFLTGNSFVRAQLTPEIGYVHPAGGQAGTTVDIVLGGYDWTPDMQVFVQDPRIKLEIVGPPSEVLIAEPPYWFGYKARGYAWPLPREFPARLTIPADVPAGVVRWQVANANGASPVGTISVSSSAQIVEDPKRTSPQVLPALPVTVSGQIRRIEEVDRYRFRVPKSGPVTIELWARRLGSPLHGMCKVRDPAGRVVLDVADTEGRDFTVCMNAQADTTYDLELHDLDFAGDRSYVYRLSLTSAPQVLAAYPAAGRRGETRSIEFVGIGVATGGSQLESVTRDVVFPASPEIQAITNAVETPWGTANPLTLLVSDVEESVEPAQGTTILKVPGAMTGTIESRFGADQFTLELKKGETWDISGQARRFGSPLDIDLVLLNSEGKQVAANEDAGGSTDPEMTFVVPADGTYRLIVSDRSGKSGTRGANYRVSVTAPKDDVELTVPAVLSVPLGASAKLAFKVTRRGAFKGPVPLTLAGLPAGVTVPADLVIPEEKNDLAVDVTCAADAAVAAALCSVSANPVLNGSATTRTANPVVVAITMKPRIKLTPEGLDDVRKVHRGSTFLAPMLIERLEGFDGPITLEMTAKQQRHRQGLTSGEMVVAPDAKRVEYTIFVPEWMETTKTSRMILNGSVRVADPKGTVRTLLQRQELRFGILPEGALMKLSHTPTKDRVECGGDVRIALSLSIAPEFREPIRITLEPDESQAGAFSMQPITLPAGQLETTAVVRIANDARCRGEQSILFRATALKDGRWPVISETSVLLEVRSRP